MDTAIQYLRELTPITMVIRLLLAMICGGIVGMQRQKHGRAAGFRTHIMVCVGATMATMTGIFMAQTLHLDADPSRIAAQVLSGIGFLGVGTIIVTGKLHVKGLTTAAGLWAIASVGLAVGAGFYEAAIVCVVIISIAMTYLGNFGSRKIKIDVYLEVNGSTNINGVLKAISQIGYVIENIEIQVAKSGTQGNVGLSTVIGIPKKMMAEQAIDDIIAIENIVLVVRCD